VVDDSFYVLFNAHHEPLPFALPTRDWGQRWVKVLDTNEVLPQASEQVYEAGQQVPVEARSLVVLCHVT
jgi:glycogen operon protein